MGKNEEYNGWNNYETWVTKLWLDNDQGTYNLVREWADEEEDNYKLSKRIKEYVEELNPLEDQEASVFNDLLNASISMIGQNISSNLPV